MAETFDDWQRKVSDKVGEPVLGLIGVQPRGAAGAAGAGIGLSRISPLASMAVSKMQARKGNPKAGGLGKISVWQTKSAILAATAEKLYVFEAKYGMGGLKLKDPIFVWPRRDVKISAERKKATAAIDIQLADGTTFEVESMMLGGGARQLEQFTAVMQA
ncbi:MAG TPA: hypothetical protein VIH82_06875 [Acidimicrobiia bacterium]